MFEVTRGYIADAYSSTSGVLKATWSTYMTLIADVFNMDTTSSSTDNWVLRNADGSMGFNSARLPVSRSVSGNITYASCGILVPYNQAMGSNIDTVSSNSYLGRVFRLLVNGTDTTIIHDTSWVCVKTDDLTVLHFFAGSGGPGGTGSRSLGYIAYYEYDNDGETVPVIVISGTGYNAESAVGIGTDPRDSLGNGNSFSVPYLAFTPATFAEGVTYRLASNVGTKVMGMVPMPFCYNELDFQPHPKLFCITDRPGTTEFEEGWITLNGERYYVLGLIAIKE